MLIKCYECAAEVSDLASACPRCGAPFGKNAAYLSRHKEFVDGVLRRLDDVFGRVCRPRSDYGDEAVEKILSIPVMFDRLERKLVSKFMTTSIRIELFMWSEGKYGIPDYQQFLWSKYCDPDVIRDVVNDQLFKFLDKHIDEMLLEAVGCRDLLLDIMVLPGWSDLPNYNKCLKEGDCVRKYVESLYQSPSENSVRLGDRLLKICQDQLIIEQRKAIEQIRGAYLANSRRCVGCNREVDDIRYFYNLYDERYGPAECGRIGFEIAVPRCRDCAEKNLRKIESLSRQIEKLELEKKTLRDSFWAFKKEEKLNSLEERIRELRIMVAKTEGEHSNFMLLREIDKFFPFSQEYAKGTTRYWIHAVPLRRTYRFTIEHEGVS